MNKGWKTWSTQAAELQLLQADRENRKAQGQGFFKMIDEAISSLQEDIAKDLYDMAVVHREEASRIMQEFDKHDVNTVVHLDNLAAEQWCQTPWLRAPETDEPRPSAEDTHNFMEDDNDNGDGENGDEDKDEQHEPSLFDIL